MHANARCHPRIGILGNPSDGYGGRVLAACFSDFCAEVELREAERWCFQGVASASLDSFADESLRRGDPGLAGLLYASARVWTRRAELRPYAMTATTDIPLQVGLSGSSAVLVASLRALCALDPQHAPTQPVELARMALAAEREVLGIAAGPQDRLIQALGTAAHLDFGSQDWSFERVPPRRLPRLGLLWARAGAAPSGEAHGSLRARFDGGDAALREAMRAFAQLSDEGLAAMLTDDDSERLARFAALLDRAWQLRCEHYPLSEGDRALARFADARGCAATLAGSGGALVFAPRDGDATHVARVVAQAREAGIGALEPRWTREALPHSTLCDAGDAP